MSDNKTQPEQNAASPDRSRRHGHYPAVPMATAAMFATAMFGTGRFYEHKTHGNPQHKAVAASDDAPFEELVRQVQHNPELIDDAIDLLKSIKKGIATPIGSEAVPTIEAQVESIQPEQRSIKR